MSTNLQALTVSDEVAADPNGISESAAVGNNAALVIGGALHVGAAIDFGAGGRKVVVTSGGNDTAISFTIVGTDVNDTALTESLTGANTGDATSTNFFKTLASITAVGNPAGTVIAGSTADCAQVISSSNGARLKGLSVVSGGSAGVINLHNTSPTGTIVFKARTVGTDNTTVDQTIPDDGIVFSAGCYVTYTVATIDMMTFFFKG